MRIGLGFEFTLKKGGDPTAVHLAYACFKKVIEEQRRQFEGFVTDNQLEIEWTNKKVGAIEIVPMDAAVGWLLNLPAEPSWIFIGRLLKRDQDVSVLENPIALASVMKEIFSGFRSIWEKTGLMAQTR
jgi:hypothetical protein